MTDMRSGLTGIVLAGGLSTRLGRDKVRLKAHGEDQPDLLGRTCGLLGHFCERVMVSCRNGNSLFDGFSCVVDEENNLGPIGGIYSALRAVGGPILALSCDLPFIGETVLERLCAERESRAPGTVMTTFRQRETGYIEPLVSIYEYEALPWFSAAIEKGIRQINRVLPEDKRHDIFYEAEEALPFFNINYPADLETARRLIAALGQPQGRLL